MKVLFVLLGLFAISSQGFADCVEHSVEVRGLNLYSCQDTSSEGLVLRKGLNTANFRSFLKANETDKKVVKAVEKIAGATYKQVVAVVEKAYTDGNPVMNLSADNDKQFKDLQQIATLYNEQRATTVFVTHVNEQSISKLDFIVDLKGLDSIVQSNDRALRSLRGSCESNSKVADKVRALNIKFSDGETKIVIPAGMSRVGNNRYRLDFIGAKMIESRYLIEEGGKMRYEDQAGNQWVVRIIGKSYEYVTEKGAAQANMSNACYLAQAYSQATGQAASPQVTQGSSR